MDYKFKILIDHEITEDKYEKTRLDFIKRRHELGIGTPTMLINMERKVKAYHDQVSITGGMRVNTGALTSPRDLLNFEKEESNTTASKVYCIIAYLAIVEMEKKMKIYELPEV